VDPLIEALKDREENVRDKAAEALGDIGDKRAVKYLEDIMMNDKHWFVRKSAAEALNVMEVYK
ncbi:MAG: HEAT repeat domain-containing protein, partial [Candidatus Hadarchaeota archaeon]